MKIRFLKSFLVSAFFFCAFFPGTRIWAQYEELTGNFSEQGSEKLLFSEIVRGNFASLEIAPFKFRAVGTMYGAWGDYVGGKGSQTLFDGGMKTSVFGGTLGGDWLLTENCLAGIHVHAGRIGINPDDSNFDGRILSVGALGRISIFGTRWYWDGSIGLAGNRNSADFLLNDYECSAAKSLLQTNYQTEFGLKLQSGFTNIEPFVGFRAITLSSGEVDMTGSSTSKQNSDTESASARSLIGSRFTWEYATRLASVRPSLRGAWIHEFSDNTVFTSDDMLLFPIAGEFGGKTFARDRAQLGAGVSTALRDMVDLFADYSCTFASEETVYSVSGGFHIKY